MVRLTTIILSAIASLTAMVQADCDEGAMQCGRQLIDDEGYTQADLIAILNNTQQPYDNDHIFESIFYCDSSNNGNGWVYYEWCGGQDSCVAGDDEEDAACDTAGGDGRHLVAPSPTSVDLLQTHNEALLKTKDEALLKTKDEALLKTMA